MDSKTFASMVLAGRGFPNVARYVREHGPDSLDPACTDMNRNWDEFYGKCLKEGHTWDYYHKYPKDALF